MKTFDCFFKKKKKTLTDLFKFYIGICPVYNQEVYMKVRILPMMCAMLLLEVVKSVEECRWYI